MRVGRVYSVFFLEKNGVEKWSRKKMFYSNYTDIGTCINEASLSLEGFLVTDCCTIL
jgi:hypothetical protein